MVSNHRNLATYIKQRDVLKVALLLEKGVDLSEYDYLPVAIDTGDGSIVSMLIEHGADIHETMGDTTYLHYAVQRHSLDVVKVLIDAGITVNISCVRGYTPLHNAVMYENMDTVKHLVSRGANIWEKDGFGRSIMHLACLQQNAELLDYALSLGHDILSLTEEGDTVWHVAVRNGRPNTSFLRLLLNKGVDINARNKKGDTALHIAASMDHSHTVQFLIDSGSRLDIVNHAFQTPYYIADQWNHTEVKQTLNTAWKKQRKK